MFSERHLPPIPAVLLSQARLAARGGLTIDAVVRRYSACDTLIRDVFTKEAEDACLVEQVKLSDILRVQGILFDRLIAAVSDEHRRESSRLASPELMRFAIVKGLLAGEARDTAELHYNLDAFHLAAIMKGTGASSVAKGLASALDCVPLVVQGGDGATWAWLGRRMKPDVGRIEELVGSRWPATVNLAIGEPGYGEAGWRQSHKQASAAFLVALRKPGSLIRYAEDPLLFTAMRDDLLSASLRDLYLVPLTAERDGGASLRQTLRAYFAAGRNGAAAAAALRVSRQTIKNRLRAVEDHLGRPLTSCTADLEAALQLHDLAQAKYIPNGDKT